MSWSVSEQADMPWSLSSWIWESTRQLTHSPMAFTDCSCWSCYYNNDLYLGSSFAVKHHKNQIQVRQVQQIVILAGQTKSAVGILYVYLVFLVCHLPYLICLVAQMNGPSIVLKRFSLLSFTLLYLNSSLNPVMYCWNGWDTFETLSWTHCRTCLGTKAAPYERPLDWPAILCHDSVSLLLSSAFCIRQRLRTIKSNAAFQNTEKIKHFQKAFL